MVDRGDGDYAMLRNKLRQAWGFDPERETARAKARVPYDGTDKRCKWLYTCAHCKDKFKRDQTEIDHIVPCGRFTLFKHRDHFLKTLFCKADDNLQILCKKCHKKKSKIDRGTM